MGDVKQVLEVESRGTLASQGAVAVLGTSVGNINTVTLECMMSTKSVLVHVHQVVRLALEFERLNLQGAEISLHGSSEQTFD